MDIQTKFNLIGKTALITGSAGLLGFEHAAALIESGASVFLTDIDKLALGKVHRKLRKLFPIAQIYSIEMDVTDEQCILNISNDINFRKIRIDILINNAAIDPKVDLKGGVIEASRLENFESTAWDLQLAVGLKGAFLCSKVFGSRMAEDGKGGVILNIASDLSIISPDQRIYQKHGLSAALQPVKPITYSVVKAGMVGMTRYLATYWVQQGVRCNALSPGGVENGQNPEFINRLNSLIPLGRMAQLNEYRSAIQFLCSDASAYMNGHNLVMDGGRSVW